MLLQFNWHSNDSKVFDDLSNMKTWHMFLIWQRSYLVFPPRSHTDTHSFDVTREWKNLPCFRVWVIHLNLGVGLLAVDVLAEVGAQEQRRTSIHPYLDPFRLQTWTTDPIHTAETRPLRRPVFDEDITNYCYADSGRTDMLEVNWSNGSADCFRCSTQLWKHAGETTFAIQSIRSEYRHSLCHLTARDLLKTESSRNKVSHTQLIFSFFFFNS